MIVEAGRSDLQLGGRSLPRTRLPWFLLLLSPARHNAGYELSSAASGTSFPGTRSNRREELQMPKTSLIIASLFAALPIAAHGQTSSAYVATAGASDLA